MKGSVEQVVVEKIEDGDKEKKKKRRSGRRSKQNPSPSALCNSVNQMPGEASEHLGNGGAINATTSLGQHKLEICPPDEIGFANASNVAFNSLPPIHINGRANQVNMQSSQNGISHPSDPGGKMFSKSCPESLTYKASSYSFMNKGFPSPYLMENYAQKNFFSPHWSLEAVNDALEKGDIFKALFCVNAHNRIEAYCKIEGVPTDVLISGIGAQNRAVEGDIVAVKVDPLSLWTKMKSSTASCKNSLVVEDINLVSESNNVTGNSCKGKGKIDVDSEYAYHGNHLSPEMELYSERETFLDEPYQSGTIVESSYDHVDVNHSYALDSSRAGSSSGLNYTRNAVEKICAVISSYPSKRPTGKVLAVIERSPRRDAVVGFLNVKQWISYQEICRKDAKKSKSALAFADHEYIQLTPTDPRFPKMMVLVQCLPKCLKERLENGDVTLEMELVAARIDNWGEDSLVPQACVSHTFGRAGELEPQLTAILFENAICSSEFSPKSLACLPHLPWEVPLEEFRSRRDLRNLCIFTVDPSTATDLDDALSVERLSNGVLRVGVHIADASYFVLPDTELDKEVQIRSNSVYMLKKKLPMLPPLLSENLGSLNAGVDRLAFSVFLDINLCGDIVDRWIGRTVIRSCCKLSYEHAQEIIDGPTNSGSFAFSGNSSPQLHGHFEWLDVISSIKDLHELSKILREKRYRDGALGLESSKVVFLFDENGNPYDSMLSERTTSNFLVEEFMILANRTAAEVISRAFPDSVLLRRHPEPNMRKLKEFEAFCCRHGLELDTSSSGQFHLSLKRIREKLKDDSTLFDILMNYASRPMQLATYFCTGDLKDNENDWGHYALAVPLYTHFTSPLRRYPDIVVHRALSAVIEAEEMYLKHQRTLNKFQDGPEVMGKCFTGINFEKDATESLECREALSAAALKHRVPDSELLAKVAAYCNDRNLASRRVKDACDKLYMWALLKKKQILLSEARVLGLGPRFMSIYVQKFGIERRIYYDEVEGLMIEWLESTSTLVLTLYPNRRSLRRGSPGKWRPVEDVALIVSPCDLKAEIGSSNEHANSSVGRSATISKSSSLEIEIGPSVFPLTARLLSTIPVVLHAIGGDDGPLDIGARLYMSSYFR
ncbi:Nucleic acid-binding, OB-fold containing protein [Parasponia andersonii]|uniref:DIS3-like exonuclease 2 n=1 Tax=Parasponia andersonii TaxID=3476 RepID=A0A2P5CFN6_PARAD|nr:Nucleic acid-binding, OB-fold containing protein [Parasponia andersonii]